MSKKGKFVAGLALGALAGVVAGWFTAPKPGKELRADVKNKAKEVYEDVRDRSEDFVEGAKDKMGEFGEKAKAKLGWIKDSSSKTSKK